MVQDAADNSENAKSMTKERLAKTSILPWGKRNSAGVTIASSLSFENISYEIDGKKILDDISIKVEPGEVLCLLGPSGSGKTTLLRIAAGLANSTSGSLKIDGRVVANETTFTPPDKRGVGLVFQDYALFPHMTIQQNVEFGLSGLQRKDAQSQANRVLARVGLENRSSQYPDVLSGGEQQRVALARALAPRPGILLMDEPFSGLDSRLRDSIRDQSIELLRETRATTIIVTHDAEEALRVGDHVALIRDGKLVQYGTAQDLYYRPNSLFAAAFFSEINVIPTLKKSKSITTVFGDVECPKQFAEMECKLCAAIRNTDIAVLPYKNNHKGRPGRIVERRFIGTSELLEIMIDGLDDPVNIRVKADELPQDISMVSLDVDLTHLMIFEDDSE